MQVKHRLSRSLGVAGIALFLVTGAVFGANALTQPSRATDANVLTTDESASPEPTDTVEPSDSA
ncbi:MAG TPA: hypothetical protein VIM24_08415, partial [Candidatus Limnocylindrales bacterium]